MVMSIFEKICESIKADKKYENLSTNIKISEDLVHETIYVTCNACNPKCEYSHSENIGLMSKIRISEEILAEVLKEEIIKALKDNCLLENKNW